MSFKRIFLKRLVKWLGFTATLVLFTAALVPDVLKVPLNWRPWVFVTSIFWFLAFCAGIFNE